MMLRLFRFPMRGCIPFRYLTWVVIVVYSCWIATLTASTLALSTAREVSKVAVIGATGRLGREAIKQLSQQGIATRCLVRNYKTSQSTIIQPPNISSTHATNNKEDVVSFLRALPGVELISGDINDEQSLIRLIEGTSACLALHGPTIPKPFFRALFPMWFPETDANQPKQINYIGIQTLLSVMTKSSTTCKHLVRITGKGETPWSIFSILINAFGGMAKGWNYEGEQLIRSQTDVRYTIIRPGILKESITNDKSQAAIESTVGASENTITKPSDVVLGLRDNGNDMKVSEVTYQQIANLTIQVLSRQNCQRTTLMAMNVDPNSIPQQEYQSIDEVQHDTRAFPKSLINEHKQAARFGGIAILCVSFLMINTAIHLLLKIIGFVASFKLK